MLTQHLLTVVELQPTLTPVNIIIIIVPSFLIVSQVLVQPVKIVAKMSVDINAVIIIFE